ncbi:MAG TPA: hypothetical protein VFE30_02635 [Anaeromyxobacteraceae bacterium]|jgi:hypothetical protein|nr:hypothetical protein [Anaeromyxobacteraceae bacterium]
MRNSNAERAALVSLLAPYELRDGHVPGQPFDAARDPVGRGWHGLLKELVEDLIRLGWDREVLQVKEKFGTLRFYVKDRRPEYLERMEVAMEHSGEVCELCGRPGALRVSETGWHATRCEGCSGTGERRSTS